MTRARKAQLKDHVLAAGKCLQRAKNSAGLNKREYDAAIIGAFDEIGIVLAALVEELEES